MLYQPSYPQPYSSDIDATKDNTFSCYINAEGGTQINGYSLIIYNMSDSMVYSSGLVTISPPLYGQNVLSVNVPSTSGMINGSDYTWRIQLFESYPTIWVTSGYVVINTNTTTTIYVQESYLIGSGEYIKINNELREIATYSGGVITLSTPLSSAPLLGDTYTIYSNNLSSTNYYFKARTTPTLTVGTIPSTINTKSHTFTATYIQAENVGWKYFQWTLYNSNGGVIESSDEISTGDISYTFDGLVNGITYGVGLILETQDGLQMSISPTYFNVVYTSPIVTQTPTVNVICEDNALSIDWDNVLANTGTAYGTDSAPHYTLVANEPYTNGSSVQLNTNSYIQWYIGSSGALVNLPFESTTYIHWTTNDSQFNGYIIKEEGLAVNLLSVSLGSPTNCSVGDKYYNINANLIYTAVSTNTWGSVGVKPNSSVIYYNLADGTNYMYNGTTLMTTSATVPYYTVQFVGNVDRPYFQADIFNGTNTTTSQIYLNTTIAWLLQSSNTTAKLTHYEWLDSNTWNDSYYWVESSTVNNYWFKIVLLPTGIQVNTSIYKLGTIV